MPSLLVVDDDPMIAHLVAAALRRDGVTVRAVGTLAEAREVALADRPNAVLVDLHLPDGDGRDLVAALREVPGYDPRLVVFSAVREGVLRALAEADGVDHLAKPFDVHELRAVLAGEPARA